MRNLILATRIPESRTREIPRDPEPADRRSCGSARDPGSADGSFGSCLLSPFIYLEDILNEKKLKLLVPLASEDQLMAFKKHGLKAEVILTKMTSEEVLKEIEECQNPALYAKTALNQAELVTRTCRGFQSIGRVGEDARVIHAKKSIRLLEHRATRLETSVNLLKGFATKSNPVNGCYIEIDKKFLQNFDKFLIKKKADIDICKNQLLIDETKGDKINVCELNLMTLKVDTTSKALLKKFEEVLEFQHEISISLERVQKIFRFSKQVRNSERINFFPNLIKNWCLQKKKSNNSVIRVDILSVGWQILNLAQMVISPLLLAVLLVMKRKQL